MPSINYVYYDVMNIESLHVSHDIIKRKYLFRKKIKVIKVLFVDCIFIQ